MGVNQSDPRQREGLHRQFVRSAHDHMPAAAAPLPAPPPGPVREPARALAGPGAVLVGRECTCRETALTSLGGTGLHTVARPRSFEREGPLYYFVRPTSLLLCTTPLTGPILID